MTTTLPPAIPTIPSPAETLAANKQAAHDLDQLALLVNRLLHKGRLCKVVVTDQQQRRTRDVTLERTPELALYEICLPAGCVRAYCTATEAERYATSTGARVFRLADTSVTVAEA